MDTNGLTGLVKIKDSVINNTLHVLAHHPRLKNYYTTHKFKEYENDNYTELFESFVTILNEYWISNMTIKPSSFVKFSSLVLDITDTFFLDFLIFLHTYTAKKEVVIENNFASVHYTSAMKRKRETLNGLSSFISKEFYGQYITKKKCNMCGHVSYAYELFSSIHLSIPKKITSCDISYLLYKNFSTDYSNYICSGECNIDVPEDGKKNPEHKISTKIFKLPQTLILGLDRNIELAVNKTINMEKYYNTNIDESVMYEIHSVVCKEYTVINRRETFYMYKDDQITLLKDFNSVKNPLLILYTRKN